MHYKEENARWTSNFDVEDIFGIFHESSSNIDRLKNN